MEQAEDREHLGGSVGTPVGLRRHTWTGHLRRVSRRSKGERMDQSAEIHRETKAGRLRASTVPGSKV